MFLLRLLLPFKKKLLIIYDLAVNGVGFDFYIFMENALQLKKKVGLEKFDLCIVSSETENNGLIFKKNQYLKEKKNSDENGHLRLNNVVLNTLGFYPDLNNVFFIKNRFSIFKYLFLYDYFFPKKYNLYSDYKNQIDQISWVNLEKNKNINNLYGIKIFKTYLEQAKEFKKLYNKKLITISLRESSYSKHRNSNKKEWLKVCRYLEKNNFQPVVIRDFEHKRVKINPFKKYELVPEATYNLNFRAAIYNVSYHNFVPDSGYFPLALLQKKPHLSRWKYDPKKNKKSYKSHILNCVSDFKSPNKYRLGGKNYYIFLKEDKFNIIKNFIDKKLKN